MHRRWPALFLSFVLCLVAIRTGSGPGIRLAIAHDEPGSNRYVFPEASPTADDEPDIDLLSYGAWGIASRDFEQSGEDLDFALFYTISLAAFPDEAAAREAFPQIVEEMLALPQYETLEEVEVDDIADEQIFHYGEFESNGFTFNVGVMVVRNGAFLTLIGSVAFETFNGQDHLVELATLANDNLENASPETGDDLVELLPEPEDLPGADELADLYLVEDEDVRLAE